MPKPPARVMPVPRKQTNPGWPAPQALAPRHDVASAATDDEPTRRETPASRAAVGQREAELLESNRELLARNAELERRERVREETASPASHWPPKVEVRRPSPVPSSGPAGGIRIEGPGGWRLSVGQAVVLALLTAAGIGGGVTAIAKPSVDPAKADATLATVEAIRSELTLVREQLSGVLRREAARDAYLRCVDEGMNDLGSQLLPAQDKQGAAAPLRAWVDRCQRLRP